MPVDYFSGFNSGSDTLINALNEYRKDKEDAPAREMQRLMLAEKLEETKRRRETLADIKRIQGLGEKPPESVTPTSGTDTLASSFPTSAPPQMTSALNPILGDTTPVPEEMATPAGSYPQQPPTTPVRKYSQQEKNKLMLQSAVKHGDWETVQRLGNAIEMTDKLDKQDAAQLSWWATQVQQFRKVTNNPEAAKVYGQNLAEKMGIPPEQVAGIDFTPKADIVKPDGQGGQVMIMTDDAGKQHFMHIAAKDAAHNVQEIPSPDGKTAQKFQYNSETKRYDIPVGAPYKVKSQVQSINVQSGPQTYV